ncbi:remodeling and spacing factor 1-like isoform X1 [Macrosteles quadrilineatus]|uniref:remodeling and spacing factor 1-like isoform X1 n=1 Tax=Macrosteles quadrilineatus TaxID=74068 RepID=UPI0023E0F7D9|nr:remodeling and spacing factor 1-like isoform X1 [Macrosteles quadrilineatus]
MASEKESPCQDYCANDPNFAIICSFFDRFAITCGITYPTFAELQEMIENTQDVPPELIDLHVKLLRKIRRSVATEKWEKALIKFCHSYLCNEEGWELERCGYKKCKVSIRLKILKTLLDAQFDLNSKFKNDINKLTPEELRLEPLGRDKVGQSYWCQFDSAANVRVYKEDQDEETWALVAKDREGLVGLITQLSSGEELLELELINEDSNSQEVEKPIIDTGQVEQSTSEENTVDSVASKNELPVKEESSCINGISKSDVSNVANPQKEVLEDTKSETKVKIDNGELSDQTNKCTANPQKEVLEDTKCEIKVKVDNDEVSDQTIRCTDVSLDNNHEVTTINGNDHKDEVEPEKIIDKGCLLENKKDINQADSISALKTENYVGNENNISQLPTKTSDEVKNVAEEIKQRSLFKSTSSPLFKGKIGKSSGSKLDQIFSRKLEQSSLNSIGKVGNVEDGKETSLHLKTLVDDDSCSQSSVLSNVNEQESNSISKELQVKRKADELCEEPSKKQCLEEFKPELEPEVGEEIEEPVMIIKGEGSGQECDTGNPGKDSEEEVGTQNMNKTASNKSEITQKNEPSDNSFTEDILLEKSLNNGISSDNGKLDEFSQIKVTDSTHNNLEITKKDGNLCDISKPTQGENTLENFELTNTDKSELEMNKSIEEQMSDLTGEGLSPKGVPECQRNTDNKKETGIEVNSKTSEKLTRRKSLDSTDDVDTESIPPEAKKTKVEKDCNDIFGTDDSMPYSTEEKKLDDKRGNLNDRVPELKVTNDFVDKETQDKSKSSENDDPEDLLTKSNIKGNVFESQKEANSKPVDDIKASVGKEITSVENKSLPKKDEDSLERNEKINTYDPDGKVESNENYSVEDNLKKIDRSKEKDAESNVDETTSKSKIKESKIELESEVKSDSTISSNPTKERINDEGSTSINPLSEQSEVQEKDEKVPSDNKAPKCASESVKKDENKDCDIKSENEAQSDSSTKDNDGTAKKKKTPVKKSPKPRRKVFTPKSRKRANKNKPTKDESENSSVPGDKNSPQKLDLEEKGNQIEKSKDEGDLSEKKETKAKPISGRKRRNSHKNVNTEKESEEDLASDKKANTEEDDEEIGGKRRKVKGKRAPNKSLRKGVEEKRNCKSSSEEENHSDDNKDTELKKSFKESKTSPAAKKNLTAKTAKSNQGKGKQNVKSNLKSKKDDASKITDEDVNDEDDDKSDESTEKKPKKSKGRNSRAFSGINLDIDLNDTSRSVRQSSRIAQIKIKEQADHKHGDDHHQNADKPGKKNKKKKDDNEEAIKGTPKKKKKTKKESDDDVPEDEPLSERKKRRRKKRKHPVKAFNERDPWKSSSGSSSAEEEEEDHFDDIVEEDEELPLPVKSDHEFSPESDLEADEEWKPVRRARTAQKVKEPTEETEESSKDLDDFACEKCGKKDHPEWILLCDTCNLGWHASCLRPSLMLVPEGDWHCPPCQHATLVKKLQETLRIYDKDTKRRENEELRRKRLAYVGISLDNVLPGNAHPPKEKPSGSESSESSASRSDSESEYSDEPVYQLRQRRSGTTSYRFNEYDELINSAIREEVEGSGGVLPAPVATTDAVLPKDGEGTPQTNQSSAEINGEEVKANATTDIKEKEEKPKKKREESDEESSDDDDSKNEDDEDEFPRVVPKRTTLSRPGRKKHRKLNSLDDPSDDDDDDEDFKGSSSEEEEEEDEDDDSDESGGGRRKSRRGNMEPVRRSSRARKSRFDKEFINDDSEESDAPRSKKSKKLWSDSGSESDDSTWGRRKKKKGFNSSRGRKFQKSKKFTIEDELSDIESSKTPKKKRQRKIKYGGLDDLAVEELPSRRTRGKKINYVEVLGTDSDEDIQKTKSFKKAVIEDDDEFDAEKEKQETSAGRRKRFGEEEESANEEKSSEEDNDESEEDDKELKNQDKIIQNKESENHLKTDEKEVAKPLNIPSNNVSPPKVTAPKVTPPKVAPAKAVNKGKPPGRRGRPPKAMIAPPPERLISEDEQYKAVVSKVATIGHNMSDISVAKAVNVSDYPQKFSETKDFMEPPQPVTPIKIPNSSFDPKLVKRNPPIKIRSGVPVNAGVKSPTLGSPTSDMSMFSVKSPNSGSLSSPPDGSQLQMQRNIMPLNSTTARKSINVPLTNVKTEVRGDEEDLDDEDLMDEIEEEEEEEDEDDSEDDVLEEGEIPKKVARRMARMEEKLEKRKMAKQMEKLKSVQTGAVTIQSVSPGAAQPATDQKPTPTTQPTQPLLRVVSPLKLMANPPGPLQSTFMNPGLGPRMPIGSPPPSARMPMGMRPPQPSNMPTGGEVASRKGRGRGKKGEKEEMMVPSGGSVIRGMLQQPQSYPPSHYQQQYPPRIPYNPQQRMPRPPFHPGHPHPMDPSPSGGGPINVKQEPGAHPVSSPMHIPNKPPSSAPPQPYHPQHRFDTRPPGYPPRPQYGSYPPPPVSSSGYGHYGSYPPPPPAREDYVAPPQPQPQYNEQFSEQPTPPPTTPQTSKPYNEEEGSGEFGGLVSYFSSQREEDIDT